MGESSHSSEYSVDPVHSSVGFSVMHLMISNIRCVFGDYTASFRVDAEGRLLSVRADIKTASIDTMVQMRDEHIRSAEFFDAAKYPEMAFRSTSVRMKKGGSFTMTGDFTLKDITRQIKLDGSVSGPVNDSFGKVRMGFSAHSHISRQAFGLTWNELLDDGGAVVGDDVTISLDGEGVLVDRQ